MKLQLEKKTKIICTLGPASQNPKILEAMIKSGMNIARLNFSHGSYENHALLIKTIRAISKKLDLPIAIIQDLQGPKIRVAELKKPLTIRTGQTVVIGKDFSLDFDVSGSVRAGERILIEDGILGLRIKKIAGKLIYCQVQNGGLVQSHKGINLPDSKIKFPIITKKDICDLQFGLKQDLDFVAMSFVRGKQDILAMKKLIKKYSGAKKELPLVIAKIEKKEAVQNFDQILQVVDGVMVARGDLGVEIEDKQVPIIQKDIVAKCIAAGKPVIVATQMLDSMIRNPRPTRAEVSDVANAVIDGADCVMLSGESAFGKYPLKAVSEMSSIIQATEKSIYGEKTRLENAAAKKSQALEQSIHELVSRSGAKAIFGAVHTFETAALLSHDQPQAPILLFASKPKLLRQLCALANVYPVAVKKLARLNQLGAAAKPLVRRYKLAKKGNEIVLLAATNGQNNFDLIEMEKI